MIKKLIRHYAKSEFVKNVSKLMTGTVIAQAIPVLISPVLSRFYSPEDFGLYALYTSLVAVFAVLATGQYDLAVMLPKYQRDAFHVLALSLMTAVSVGVLFFVAAYFFGDWVANLLGSQRLKYWIYAVPPGITVVGSYKALNYWFNRKKQYGGIARANVARGITAGGINLSWIAFAKGAGGLVFGHLLGWFLMVSIFITKVFRQDFRLIRQFSFSRMCMNAVRYKRFPMFSTGSAFLNILSVQIPVFMLSVFFAEAIVGYYSLSMRVLSVPATVLGLAVGQVFFRNAAEQKENPDKLRKITLELYKKMFLIGFIPMMILMVFADYIFPIVFGAEWQTAGRFTQFLSPAILFVFIASPLAMLFSVLERQAESMVFYAMLFGLRILALLIGGLWFDDEQIAVLLFGAAGALMWGGVSLYLLKMVKVNLWYVIRYTALRLLAVILVLFLLRYGAGLFWEL
jgi:O-antigen/teichoic acid export membrane protein